ncbi:MAG: tetratricopeptide repeat protein [Actinobacteria bacterium]|nr:tetratricopeptide repeat protein [Actinomycetota bacterium]
MSTSSHVQDVETADFQTAVIERSKDVPVVVDFWAAWCGPCRTLGPALEAAVTARNGDIVLAKVDVDRNQQLAAQFGIRGIPAVKAFKDGKLVDQFTGALPPQQIEAFLDRIAPTAADRLATQAAARLPNDPAGAAATFEEALELDGRHLGAALGLAELVLDDDPQRALDLVSPHRPEVSAEAIAAKAQLAFADSLDLDVLRTAAGADPTDAAAQLELGRALAATGEYRAAIDHLLRAVRLGGATRDAARDQLVQLFTILGDTDPLVKTGRRELANALF